jgi:hypothetical protein
MTDREGAYLENGMEIRGKFRQQHQLVGTYLVVWDHRNHDHAF